METLFSEEIQFTRFVYSNFELAQLMTSNLVKEQKREENQINDWYQEFFVK
jgi:hypothetical protein